jgi:4-amino-4-deoxy-L-arabinose transferase-like glycosyltransferase
MVLLLPSSWLACLLLFRELAARGRIAPDWRLSFLLAAAAWGALLTFATEILSLATALTPLAVGCFWLAANAALWGGLWRCRRHAPSSPAGWTFRGGLKELQAWPLTARLLLGASLLFALFLGAIALLTPTTNWDSLTYHRPRVMQWMQNHSVAHYPTNDVAQLQMGPWDEFVQLHLWLLWGGDRFANLVQWSALLGSMIAATLLVRQLLPAEAAAAGPRVQAFAALLVVTLPTGIVEAISTQTDFVTAFWLITLAVLALEWRREPENRLLALGFGAALGLGVLTKITFVFFGLPVGLAAALALLWDHRRAPVRIVMPAVQALALCCALMLPHLARNRAVFGSAVGSQPHQAGLRVPSVTVSGTLLNLLHNAELHSNTGFEPLTHQFNRVLHLLESWTGRSTADPDLSIASSMYQMPDEIFVFDSFAASPWHVLFLCAGLLAGLAAPRRNRLPLLALIVGLAGFVVFCMILRWQIWGCRYHLPGLVLCLPPAAVLLVPRLPRRLVCVLAAGLMICAMTIVAFNRSRPVFSAGWRAEPRMMQLLAFQGVRFYGPMREAAAQITAAGCEEVGLKLSPDMPEYPLWLMLREDGFKGRIHHQFVEGPSAQLPGPDRLPDVIIAQAGTGRPVGDMAVQYPSDTTFSVPDSKGGTNALFSLYWSAKISAVRDKSARP